jgi:aspartate kinase
MKVFKFGGASLKNAAGIQNVASIITSFSNDRLLIVVSAMGKTTNALEKIIDLYRSGQNFQLELKVLQQYHHDIMRDLFSDKNHPAFGDVDLVFSDLGKELETSGDYDQIYDQVVSKGEILSSIIVNHYLIFQAVQSVWLDARQFICTDNNFREGRVNWRMTNEKIQSLYAIFTNKNVLITQGFIGSTQDGLTTTLGREGSDFSAAIFASCLEVESVTIWKDVPGVMSADPKRLPNATVFDELPFKEAAEMTYYGASVIHPKTIKPLANKQIPLLVKNFDDPSLPGTKIHECHVENLPPLIVFKENQCLISCKVTDYTFVNEQQLSIIFNVLNELDVHINVMQNSAISFSFCINFRESKVLALIEKLQRHFEVYYNTGLTLITIKNYDEDSFETYRKRPGVLMEQSSRSTLQVLVKP